MVPVYWCSLFHVFKTFSLLVLYSVCGVFNSYLGFFLRHIWGSLRNLSGSTGSKSEGLLCCAFEHKKN